ncbi:hypothetical protein ACQR1W_13620 [Bradyrhizobium sp. HKCCYLS1011]|uniref:hypothetical protein n=1 Tax=Bradyrhizobium sp. HKCCYLS1011 TaxID=3420733 RepID=UPI003EBE24F8
MASEQQIFQCGLTDTLFANGYSKAETSKVIEADLGEEDRKPETIFDFVQGIASVACTARCIWAQALSSKGSQAPDGARHLNNSRATGNIGCAGRLNL